MFPVVLAEERCGYGEGKTELTTHGLQVVLIGPTS